MFHLTTQERQVVLFLTCVFLLGNTLELFKKKKPALFQSIENYKQNDRRRKIDLNQATLAELEHLPYIGAVCAQRIVHFREAKGTFSAIDELKGVEGVGENLFSKIREFFYIKE